MTTPAAPTTTAKRISIDALDGVIDQINARLRTLETIDEMSAASWQAAWDKHPELRAATQSLYAQRGELQRQRDQGEEDQEEENEEREIPFIVYRNPSPQRTQVFPTVWRVLTSAGPWLYTVTRAADARPHARRAA